MDQFAHGSVLPMFSAALGGLMLWPPVVESTVGASKLATSRYCGHSEQWTIHGWRSVGWIICKKAYYIQCCDCSCWSIV